MSLRNLNNHHQRHYRRGDCYQYQKIVLWLFFILSNLIYAGSASDLSSYATQAGAENSHDMSFARYLSEGEDEPEGGNDGEEESEESDTVKEVTAAVIIGAVIIALTIIFEVILDFLLEWVHHDIKPIIEATVGELTTLGFVSLFTYMISKAGALSEISKEVFGEEEEDKLQEIFETVHYTMFAIMAFFCFSVLIQIRRVIYNDKEWISFNAQCVLQKSERNGDDTSNNSLKKSERDGDDASDDDLQENGRDSDSDLKKSERDGDDASDSTLQNSGSASSLLSAEFLRFRFMRDEFIKDRSLMEPFEPSIETGEDEENKRGHDTIDNLLADDFDFGRYLSIQQVHLMKKLIHVEPSTWLTLLLPFGFAYAIYHAFETDILALAWTWTIFGWTALLHLILMRRNVEKIRQAFCTTDAAPLKALNLPIIKSNDDNENEDLPAWCYIDIEKYNEQRSKVLCWILGDKFVNRQEALFWGERYGPKLLIHFFQVNFLFQIFYCSLVFIVFIAHISDEHYSGGILACYLILSILPIILFVFANRLLVSEITEVTSIGIFRSSWAIAETIRERKISGMVRTFVFLYKMRQAATLKRSMMVHGSKVKNTPKLRSISFKDHEIKEILDTFHALDKDKNGDLCSEDLRHIMSHVGVSMSQNQLSSLIQKVDTDGDGQVSVDEFLQWYKNHLDVEVDSTEFFTMLDRRGAGQITIADLKAFIDGFNLYFSIYDVAELIREIDEDGDGVISEKEIEKLLELYHPKEITPRKNSNIMNCCKN